MKTTWRFRADRTDYGNGLALFITRGDYDRDDAIDVVTGVTIERMGGGFMTPPSPIAERDAEAFLRAALNCAWELGLRPDGLDDTREQIAATRKHLEDMRAIAFHKVGATKP